MNKPLTLKNPDEKKALLITCAGSTHVNGVYSRMGEDDGDLNSGAGFLFEKNRASDDPRGTIFIITLDSQPGMGEELEWVIQSHDAISDKVVTYYSAPVYDFEKLPFKGWSIVSGIEPPPRISERPKIRSRFQVPKMASLGIIGEDDEREFSVDPFVACDLPVTGTGELGYSHPEADDDDPFLSWFDNYKENNEDGEQDEAIELPEGLMGAFKDGQFTDLSEMGRVTPRGDRSPRDDNSDGKWDSDDEDRNDLREEKESLFEHWEEASVMSYVSERSNRYRYIKQDLPTSILTQIDESEDDFMELDLSDGRFEFHGTKPLIVPGKGTFGRPGRDSIDIDLIGVIGDVSVSRTKRQKSLEKPRKSNTSTILGLQSSDDVGVRMNESKEATSSDNVKTDLDIDMSTEADEKDDDQRIMLQKELHDLKIKVRKCDRTMKLRKRRPLTTMQEELLANTSDYQERIVVLLNLLAPTKSQPLT